MSETITRTDLTNILNEVLPTTDCVTDVEVNGTSVVTDGVAEVTLPTATTPTISISTSTGSLVGYTIRKYGHIVQLHLQVKKTSATASGANVYQGTISTTALRPLMITTSATYLGAYSLPATIGTDGLITVRNATESSLAAMTSNANVSFTYIVS